MSADELTELEPHELRAEVRRLRAERDALQSGLLCAIATGESMEDTPKRVLVTVLRNLREVRDGAPPKAPPAEDIGERFHKDSLARFKMGPPADAKRECPKCGGLDENCPTCDGTGAVADAKTCATCGGKGFFVQIIGRRRLRGPDCPDCGGGRAT